jgi:hypothetical protein
MKILYVAVSASSFAFQQGEYLVIIYETLPSGKTPKYPKIVMYSQTLYKRKSSAVQAAKRLAKKLQLMTRIL